MSWFNVLHDYMIMSGFSADYLAPDIRSLSTGPGKADRVMLAAGRKVPVIHRETRQTRRHAWRDDRLAGLRK